MNIKNLLVSGCSFSAGGLGGIPPNNTDMGGCSFNYDKDYPICSPNSWPGFLAKKLNVISLVNLATPGQGNILVANSLLEILRRYNYKITDTLIVFNLTDPWRLDIPCDPSNANIIQSQIPWDKTLIPYSYISESDKHIKKIKLKSGVDAIEQFTSNTIEFLFNLLEYQKWNYRFLMMNNYLEHGYLGSIVYKFQNKLIKLDSEVSMIEFCKKTNTCISKTNLHPSIEGHKAIANIIYEHLNS